MTEFLVQTSRGLSRASLTHRRVVGVGVAYATITALLVWTRLVHLDRSFWEDELLTVTRYVRGGPREIILGAYLPNNHEFFSIMGWATSSLVGESEVALRLLAALPFIVGVVLVTAWLHARIDALTALLFLFFATASPLLFDISRQARGYGLAFFAMSVLVVTASELRQRPRTALVAAFFSAGVIGTLTLPSFGLAFIATASVLLFSPVLRRRTSFGLAVSLAAIAAWYAPHVDDLLASSGQRDGTPIPWLGLPISPVDQILVPGMFWFDDAIPYPARYLVVAGLLVILASSPLLVKAEITWILAAPVVATMVVVWAAQLYLHPRFVSYLLVPLLVLLARGVVICLRLLSHRPASPRALLALATIVFAIAAFAGAAGQLLRHPGEAWKDASAAIEASVPSSTPVLARISLSHPLGLEYYLPDYRVTVVGSDKLPTLICRRSTTVVYVLEPYHVPATDVPCLNREGASQFRFRQHSRGGEISVWIVPPRSARTVVRSTG